MLIPLGLGNTPKKRPWAIFMLVLLMLMASGQKFIDIWSFSIESDNNFFDSSLVKMRVNIIYDSCIEKLDFKDCQVIKAYRNPENYPTKNIYEISKVDNYLLQFLEKKPEQWPTEAQNHPLYSQYLKKLVQLEQINRGSATKKNS